MAPPPGQTSRDTRAADHTTCFYCHQQLILVSHKVIVSRDAHGFSIRICEPCEKEARRRRPVRLLWKRSRHCVPSRPLSALATCFQGMSRFWTRVAMSSASSALVNGTSLLMDRLGDEKRFETGHSKSELRRAGPGREFRLELRIPIIR